VANSGAGSSALFPVEQARIVQLLVERVDVREKALEVRIRAEGLVSLVGSGGSRARRRHDGTPKQGWMATCWLCAFPCASKLAAAASAPDGNEIVSTSRPSRSAISTMSSPCVATAGLRGTSHSIGISPMMSFFSRVAILIACNEYRPGRPRLQGDVGSIALVILVKQLSAREILRPFADE
jgi:hypothetical protein